MDGLKYRLSNIKYQIAFLILIFGFLCGCQDRRLYKETRVMMGTFVEVMSTHKEAPAIAFKEIRRIEGLLSKYDPQSEISRLNNSGRLQVSPETYYVVNKAKEFWVNSGQAFDVTVGPLLDLWGFTDKRYRVPGDEEIKKTLELVGMDKVILNDSESVIEFTKPGVKIDLGAIAKGFAVDCAVNKIKQAGITSCLINAGGQIYCLGTRLGRPWKVAIRNPDSPQGGEALLELRDKAVATSGNYEQFFVNNKRRYGHIFNPGTGYPAEISVVSVTVTAPDGLTADALSTCLFALGKIKGEVLLAHYPGVWFTITEHLAQA